MIEQIEKIYFPQLPFSPPISYFEINQNNANNNSSDSIESSENEYENKKKMSCRDSKEYPNNYSFIFTESKKATRKKKANIKLTENAKNFQYSFYQIFTTRKKFPKKFVVIIHNEICSNLNLKRVNRDETRSISLYFNDFANHAAKILLFIQNNKYAILKRLPELQAILK